MMERNTVDEVPSYTCTFIVMVPEASAFVLHSDNKHDLPYKEYIPVGWEVKWTKTRHYFIYRFCHSMKLCSSLCLVPTELLAHSQRVPENKSL